MLNFRILNKNEKIFELGYFFSIKYFMEKFFGIDWGKFGIEEFVLNHYFGAHTHTHTQCSLPVTKQGIFFLVTLSLSISPFLFPFITSSLVKIER